jgi:serine/threonine-protein kinase ULK4
MEYCTGGDLLGVLRQDKAIPEASVRAFAIDIIAGMQYLHSNGILFCDLKPSNVLLNEFGVLKLCDLGLARPIAADRAALQQQAATKRGTPYYMAPELFHRDGLHSFASDVRLIFYLSLSKKGI